MTRAHKKMAMNDDVAILQARAFQIVADDLHVKLNSYKKTDEGINGLVVVGYGSSIVVLRALAVELTLKALAFKRTGKYLRNHDLLKLYDDLDTDTQAIISKIEDIHGVAPVRRILEKHKNDFTDWRYLQDMQDGDKWHVNLPDIVRALDVLFLVYEGKDFLAICDR